MNSRNQFLITTRFADGARGREPVPDPDLNRSHFIHILKWEGDHVMLPAITGKIVAFSALTGGTPEVKQTGKGIEISVPAPDRQDIDTIVVLRLDSPARKALNQER